MDIRPLTDRYAVSPQITVEDVARLADQGFDTVICNRPDPEVPPPLQAAAIAAAVEAAGLTFVLNPAVPGRFEAEVVARQASALAASQGKVLAYCASGNRSAVVWGLGVAAEIGADEVLATTRRAGYDHAPLRPLFEAAATAED